MRPGPGMSSATRDLQEPLPSPGLERDFGERGSRTILDITFYHTRWGPQGGHGPFQAFPGGKELRAGKGCSQPPALPPAIATSSHCLKKH